MSGSYKEYSALFLKRLFIFFTVLLTMCSVPFYAFAMNEDYLDIYKWYDNDNVSFEEFSDENWKESVGGIFGWYVDNNMCIYTYLTLDANNISDIYDTAQIVYEFQMPSESYALTVDADGISDAGDEEKKLFSVSQNFEERKNGVFLVAVEYLGKETYCTVNVSVYLKTKHIVKENVVMELPVTTAAPKQTTTGITTTKNGRITKSSNSKTTSKVSRQSTETTTKFTPHYTPRVTTKSSRAAVTTKYETQTRLPAQGQETADNSEDITKSAEENVYAESYQDEITGKKKTLSRQSKVMLYGAIAVAALGIAMIAIAELSKRYKIEKVMDNEEKSEE